MTNRIASSLKSNSSASDYSEFEEISTEFQNPGQRATQLNPLACLNLESRETRVEVCGSVFTLKQLIDATRKFSPQMELCRGTSGVLYKAELPNLNVAVEKMHQYSKDIHEIRRNILVRKQLEHDNIVKLLDSCSIKNLDLLIYEYMENGSLKQVLFESSPVVLSWDLRFKICLGVARGLRHLDDEISCSRLVNGSIQPSNIMLDANLNAKLMDFDPKWFTSDDDPFMMLKSSSVMYMAPEYCVRRAKTEKAAVYSYGIVLFEIISGRRFAEIRENEILNERLVSYDRRPLELVDTRLVSYDYNQVLLVMNLAMMCIDSAPSRRPTMFEVVKVLEGERTIYEVSDVEVLEGGRTIYEVSYEE
ncbi:unnamed protein product [Dovyalis caffra]|uniref:Protein kinase domain-containing protein n=1 Tax=Dovyalis caffra TaxID=77055 RepID=A0AAV1SIR8_9ROSI|nr:unnamed protein product [Dovyalis caffra]